MKKIRQLDFNWFFSTADNRENWSHRTVGQGGVLNIEFYEEYGGIGHFIVDFDDGRQEWLYNVNQVYWDPVAASETPIDPLPEFDIPF